MNELEKEIFDLRGKTIDALVLRIDKLIEDRDIQATAIRDAKNQVAREKTRNEALSKEILRLGSLARFYSGCLGKAMAWIAIDVCLQKTHRDRNAYFRGIIQTVKLWLDMPVEQAVQQEIDDIPF